METEMISSMKKCSLLLLLGTLFLHGASSRLHTLRIFETSSTQVPNFPEYIAVGYMDDVHIIHYDSDTKKCVPKQEWMNKITEVNPQHWQTDTLINMRNELVSKGRIETVKRRLNVTGGLHLDQQMYGCEWDDETGEITGYHQYGFDGEDFISFDFESETYVAAKPQAFVTKQKWEREGYAALMKNYICSDCVKYLKKLVRLGESALQRTELPLVSLLQKSSSSPVTCHATGFYPDRALMFWTKDGDEVMEDIVDPGEILPNGDGTFQTSVSLDLSSVPPEDWDKYHCVFQLSGVKEDYVTKLDRTKIRTNAKSPVTSIITAVVVLGVVFIAAAAVVLFVIRRRTAQNKRGGDVQMNQNLNPASSTTNSEETSSEAETQTLNPEAPESNESN